MNFFNKLVTAANTNQSLGSIDTGNVSSIVATINSVISIVLGLLLTGVVILTIMIAYKFFTASTEDKRKNAKAQLIYAIIGIIALVALLIFAPVVVNLVQDSVSNAQ